MKKEHQRTSYMIFIQRPSCKKVHCRLLPFFSEGKATPEEEALGAEAILVLTLRLWDAPVLAIMSTVFNLPTHHLPAASCSFRKQLQNCEGFLRSKCRIYV
ncbi:hypothetical protein PoB_002276500 [Plakobranchus ocellatus]|uniref:Uncharacterized protein n=1 Tax=Plakobranchus ocellatus TaxID=259542 RepID=A0AAV3ZKQ7_9GAST|nr:hypothetical protein PoB_002276500 [Plakobranchus ocellatus]